jgi:hypothetical protein
MFNTLPALSSRGHVSHPSPHRHLFTLHSNLCSRHGVVARPGVSWDQMFFGRLRGEARPTQLGALLQTRHTPGDVSLVRPLGSTYSLGASLQIRCGRPGNCDPFAHRSRLPRMQFSSGPPGGTTLRDQSIDPDSCACVCVCECVRVLACAVLLGVRLVCL